MDSTLFADGRRQCRVAPGEDDLTLRGARPAAILHIGNDDRALLDRRGDIEEQLPVLLQDLPLQLLEFG